MWDDVVPVQNSEDLEVEPAEVPSISDSGPLLDPLPPLPLFFTRPKSEDFRLSQIAPLSRASSFLHILFFPYYCLSNHPIITLSSPFYPTNPSHPFTSNRQYALLSYSSQCPSSKYKACYRPGKSPPAATHPKISKKPRYKDPAPESHDPLLSPLRLTLPSDYQNWRSSKTPNRASRTQNQPRNG